MESIDIARRFAELNQINEAQQSYRLAIGQEGITPEEELEAASYLFFSQADHRLPFTHFVSLFNRGLFQKEIWEIMVQAFYLPNVKSLKKQYEKNKNILTKYPYFFRAEFPAFDDLPLLFFPFDHEGFVPFYPAERRFGEYVNFNRPVIDRYFFKDLEKPILAQDVYSQYQLEYLNDNVRKSEWVARENHIYLYYTDFMTFCAHLQVLNFKKILNDQKIIFLIEEEISRYPINFQAEYGIDYSEYPVKPVGIREVNRLIWQNQLSSHNGGNYFAEIFYGHPNLMVYNSIMFSSIKDELLESMKQMMHVRGEVPEGIFRLSQIKNPTDKDYLVAAFLYNRDQVSRPDPKARIVPAIYFQPHFGNIHYNVDLHNEKNRLTTLYSEEYEEIRRSPMFRGFKYIKTITPMRRPTTSYAATVRFMIDNPTKTKEENEKTPGFMLDAMMDRLLNRSFMIDSTDRLFQDSRLVRFEDGKLNPKATFTALAEFLDIPYTDTMEYCSGPEGIDPMTLRGNEVGFSTEAVYREYPEYANEAEREFIEYFTRDVYEAYGYDFLYYKGEPVDEDWIRQIITKFTVVDHYIELGWKKSVREMLEEKMSMPKTREEDPEKWDAKEEAVEVQVKHIFTQVHDKRLGYAQALLRGVHFVNRQGQPLQMMTPLKLDPNLLEQPLYH